MTQPSPAPQPSAPRPTTPQPTAPQSAAPQPAPSAPRRTAPSGPPTRAGQGPPPQRTRGPQPKQIATLPPLQHLGDEVPPSPRTGEPRRPAVVLVAMLVFLASAAATAVTYGHHWWLAAHPESYAASARLVEWVAPEPGKWLALTLEGVLAVVAALVAGITGAVGFQAWNGWRWSRWAGLVTLVLNGAVAVLFSWLGIIAAGLALVGAAMLFLPPVTEFFTRFEVHRGKRPPAYRRPEQVLYGRLPRFR